MPLTYFFCMIVLILIGEYFQFKAKLKKKRAQSLIIKGGCTFLIVLYAIYAWSQTGSPGVYGISVAAGLGLGLVGDVAIGLSFPAGVLFFALGHFCYIAAFLTAGFFAPPVIVFFAVLCLLLYMVFKNFRIDLKTYFWPVIAYAFIIVTMLALAAQAPVCFGPAGWIVTAGALLFASSDAMLGLILFGGAPKALDVVSLTSYYMGQSLLALSILYCAA